MKIKIRVHDTQREGQDHAKDLNKTNEFVHHTNAVKIKISVHDTQRSSSFLKENIPSKIRISDTRKGEEIVRKT